MAKEEKLKRMAPLLEACQTPEARQKRSKALSRFFAKMTKEKKMRILSPWIEASRTPEIREKISRTLKKRWANIAEKEKIKFLKSWMIAGHRASAKAMRRRWANMAKEEKLRCLNSWIKAGQKASKEKLANMTREEKRNYLKSFFEAGQKAAQKANPSSIEKRIWEVLNGLRVSYKTQISFDNGKFIVDIYIPNQRLIIECNGDYWHNLPGRRKRDRKLKEYAENNGYKLVELWETDIKKSPKSTLINGLKMKGGIKLC